MAAPDNRAEPSEFAAGLARRSPSQASASPWGPPPPFIPPSAEAVAALMEVYGTVDASLGPVAAACRACGRCCRFRPGGIVLFASALEMAALVADAGPPDADRLLPGGPVAGNWTCPYQEGDRCAARKVRPLGCRTYFCDANAEERGRAVHAEALHRIRAVAREYAYPWWYGPAKVYFDAITAVT